MYSTPVFETDKNKWWNSSHKSSHGHRIVHKLFMITKVLTYFRVPISIKKFTNDIIIGQRSTGLPFSVFLPLHILKYLQ